MHRRVLSTLAAVFVASLAGAPGALAASTLTAEDTGVITFRLTAEAGKANNVTVAASKNSLTISDSGDTITHTVAGCTPSGEEVECFSLGKDFSKVVLDLGDEDDMLAASGSIEIFSGGEAGNDTLSATGFVPFEAFGGLGSDTLNGGSGADTLSGGEGADTVHGNGGNDAMTIEGGGDVARGGEGNDLFVGAAGLGGGALEDGGPGVDTVFYFSVEPEAPPPSYTVDLGAGSIGSGGSSDTLVGIEDAITFQGADTVTGSAGANRINTATDEEILLGIVGGGLGGLPVDAGDTVDPKGGPDFVTTGAGNDIVNLVDGSGDRLDCGPGTDIVQADQLDELIACENVTRSTVTPTGSPSPPSPPPPPSPPVADTAAPTCSLKGVRRSYRRKAFLRGLRAAVSCNEPVTLEARLTTRAKAGAQPQGKREGKRRRRAAISRAGDLVLAEASASVAPAGALRLRPLGRLRSQLGPRFRAVVRIVVRDLAGNATILQRAVRVKPDRKKRNKRKDRRGAARRGR
jgi:hypothetical protein